MAAAMAAYILLYGAWQVLRWPAGHPELVSDVFSILVGLCASYAAWQASRRCREQPRLRCAWLLLASASASYLAGNIVWMFYELAGELPYPSAADGFYLLFYPLMLCGLLRFPAPRRTLGESLRLVLDLAVVAIGGAVIVIYVVLGPTVIGSGPDILQTAFSIAYPVGDVVLLVGLASVLLRGSTSASDRALQFIAAALTFVVVADLAYGYITLHSVYHGGDPVDALWMVATALFAVAAAAQRAPDPAVDLTPTEPDRARASWAPYLAVAATFGLLIVSLRHEELFPGLILVLAAVVLATLVSIRQFLAQRDLLHTQGRLSHQSVHDALTCLPNRALVIDRAEQMLARARRLQTPVAALYVDLDGFKHINDSFGHAAGDQVLRVIAQRLAQVVREADTVGRLGGDEFVVLLQDLTFDAGPELVAERICEIL
ncbi:MAG TPA: GGDEF domain-containing protein, partial [Solirubrobacteraceae bacterium]|nr:GGDEF domain-containing protein [Solirubrobacteraceae bacterium]